MVTGKAARRARWILSSITGAALIIGGAVRLSGRHSSAKAGAPADAGLMRALHAALRRDLSRLRAAAGELGNLAAVDAMVGEHQQIPPALAGVDAALRGGGELAAPAEHLSAVLQDHLAHEEREVLPLIEST